MPAMSVEKDKLFLRRPGGLSYDGIEVIVPSFAALLATAPRYLGGDSCPVSWAILCHTIPDDAIFLL